MRYRNVSAIYEPHFKSQCFRVACNKQQSSERNLIIVTCSPYYNGLWTYDASKRNTFEIWKNKNTACYCIPILECTQLYTLEEMLEKDPKHEFIKEVKKQQKKWYTNQVENRSYTYKSKPDWMIF